MSEPVVTLTRDGGVGVLTLNDPRARNALSDAMRRGLDRHVRDAVADPAIRALVVTGANGAFCAGGDIKAMIERHRNGGGGGAEASLARMRHLHGWLSILAEMPKPVICAVDGPAIGAGLGVALAGDLVIASERATFSAAFARIAVVPDGFLAYRLPRAVGLQRAKEMIYTARAIGADRAVEWGLALEALPPEATLPRAMDIARAMAEQSPLAFTMTKELLACAMESDPHRLALMERQAQAICLNSDDHKAAVRRFVEKKPPHFAFPD